MIKNLITGPGFVASHLADYLLEKEEEVYVTTRWTDDKSAFDHIKDRVNWIPMDLNDLKSCIDAVARSKPDIIYHLGAQSFVPDSFVYPAVTIQTNTIGTLNLLEAVKILRDISNKKNNPLIIVVSSSEVYGDVPKEEIPIKETHPFRPANPYAVSKIGEDMIAYQYWKSYDLRIIRTRFFTHTGARRKMLSAECNFARQIALIEKGKQKPILKHGNLNSVRTWANVKDAARGYYELSKKGKEGEVYNIGGTETKTIGEMLDYMLSLSSMKDKITKEEDPSLMRENDVNLQIVDTTKFREATNYEFKIPFKETIKEVLDWWRNNV